MVDVHDFSLVLPTLEYHSRTWTWHDLLMAMKKDCVNVLVSQVNTTTAVLCPDRQSNHKPNAFVRLFVKVTRLPYFQVIKEKLHLKGGHGTETKETKAQTRSCHSPFSNISTTLALGIFIETFY